MTANFWSACSDKLVSAFLDMTTSYRLASCEIKCPRFSSSSFSPWRMLSCPLGTRQKQLTQLPGSLSLCSPCCASSLAGLSQGSVMSASYCAELSSSLQKASLSLTSWGTSRQTLCLFVPMRCLGMLQKINPYVRLPNTTACWISAWMHKTESGLDQCFMRQHLANQIVSKLLWSVFFAFTEVESVILKRWLLSIC